MWFLSGAEELKESAADLSKIKFKISFPDEGPTRVVERGMLSCSEASKYCTLVLLPAIAARHDERHTASLLGIGTFLAPFPGQIAMPRACVIGHMC